MSSPLELVVLVSGNGSNLQAILDAIAAGQLQARVRLVLSNKAGAFALERAARHGVATAVLSHRDFPSREAFDAALVERVRAAVDEPARCFVVLAGFMRVLTPTFVDAFPERVVNLHPALLPAFPGVDGPAQALAKGVSITGCTVHLVDAGVDTGPILAQSAVPVVEGDDLASLSARIHHAEHELLPRVLQWIAEGRLQKVQGRSRLVGVRTALHVE